MAAERTLVIISRDTIGETYETSIPNINPAGDATDSSIKTSLRSAAVDLNALSTNTFIECYAVDKIKLN